MIHYYKSYFILLPMFMFFYGCAGTPAQNPLLDEATENYAAAERDAEIVQFAPVALKEAEEELIVSRGLWEERADKLDIEHHAYIAKQKIAIARETARFNASQQEIGRAESERQQVLLNMHRNDALQAEERARRALEEVQRERAAAEEARQMAQSERQQALLDERRNEALQAEERARLALEEAQRERASAEEANKRAKELAERVNELEARQTERGLVLTLGDVLFDFNNATLRAGGMRPINDLAKFLMQYPERNVMIEGHTDSVGSDEYNRDLSERRANSVKEALINLGVNSNRIQTQGLGKLHPVANNASEAGRQQNRRVEVIISDQDGKISER